jgi:hypothetical protein
MQFEISDTTLIIVFLAIWGTILAVGGSIIYYKLMYEKWLWEGHNINEIFTKKDDKKKDNKKR